MLDVILNGRTIGIGPWSAVSFHRRLRLPDDDRTYPLPPGLDRFPILTLNAQLLQRTSADFPGTLGDDARRGACEVSETQVKKLALQEEGSRADRSS
jgi:hypothetical protein